ncbi:hypothetical protein ACFV28_15525 [Streptomyces sp. NPDC059720]|uniref:hypothetical protein n=1 Tax=Streptomyces sp. NPDC059720 TaxID=3346924 RepID=UPI0036CDC0AD
MIDTIASKYRFGTPWMDLPAHNPALEAPKTFFIFMTRSANRRSLSQLTARDASSPGGCADVPVPVHIRS